MFYTRESTTSFRRAPVRKLTIRKQRLFFSRYAQSILQVAERVAQFDRRHPAASRRLPLGDDCQAGQQEGQVDDSYDRLESHVRHQLCECRKRVVRKEGRALDKL